MNLRQQWIEALESGKYPQGRFFLKNRGQYCCLGVLCEVAGIPKEERPDGTYYNGSRISITLGWMKAVNLGEGDLYTIAQLNDMGKDFKYIAQWLRDHDTKPD